MEPASTGLGGWAALKIALAFGMPAAMAALIGAPRCRGRRHRCRRGHHHLPPARPLSRHPAPGTRHPAPPIPILPSRRLLTVSRR